MRQIPLFEGRVTNCELPAEQRKCFCTRTAESLAFSDNSGTLAILHFLSTDSGPAEPHVAEPGRRCHSCQARVIRAVIRARHLLMCTVVSR